MKPVSPLAAAIRVTCAPCLERITSGVVGKWMLHSLILEICGLNSQEWVVKENRLYQKYTLLSIIMELFPPNWGRPLLIFRFLSFSLSGSPTFHYGDVTGS